MLFRSAFGTQKKVNVTGAVSTVGAKEIAARPVSSTVEALQGGEVAQPFDVHLVPVAQFFAADLRQTVYRVHYVAHRERAAGMYAVVELPHGYFPVEQRARMEASFFRVFLIGARILVPVI